LTTFNSGSPVLTRPSLLAPDHVDARSRHRPSRLDDHLKDEGTLSRELLTAGLLQPHVPVGDQWQNIGIRPVPPGVSGNYTASCRTSHRSGRAPLTHPAHPVNESLRHGTLSGRPAAAGTGTSATASESSPRRTIPPTSDATATSATHASPGSTGPPGSDSSRSAHSTRSDHAVSAPACDVAPPPEGAGAGGTSR